MTYPRETINTKIRANTVIHEVLKFISSHKGVCTYAKIIEELDKITRPQNVHNAMRRLKKIGLTKEVKCPSCGGQAYEATDKGNERLKELKL